MRQILAVTAFLSLLAGPARTEPIEKALRMCLGLDLRPRVALTGRIVDRASRPVAGAEVLLWATTSPPEETGGFHYRHFQTASDAAGRFRIEHAGTGRYEVGVKRRGFAPFWRAGTAGAGSRGVVDLGDLPLEPGVVLEGRVTDLRGTPVEGAKVQVHALERRGFLSNQDIEPLVTGPDGSFRLGDLESGRMFSLYISHPGNVAASAPGVEAPTAEPLQIELRPGRSLSGRVLDPDRRPVADAGLFRIELSPQGRSAFRVAETDGEGRFLASGLEPGPLSLEVHAPGHRIAEVPSLRVPEDEDPEPIEILVEPGAAVEGRVLDSRGEPMAQARVQVHRTDSNRRFGPPIWTEEDGRYRISGLEPGEHRIEASPWPPSRRGAAGKIVLGESGTYRLDLRMPAGAGVSGRVLDEQGEPLAGAWLHLALEGSSMPIPGTSSRPDGTFHIETVPDGVYRLYGGSSTHIQRTGPDVVQVDGRDVGGLVVRLERGGSITGRVLGLSGERRRDVLLIATPEGGGEPEHSGVTPEGLYGFPALAPGTWRVTVSLASGLAASGTVQVGAGEEAVLDLELPRGLALTGRVLLDGRPLPGALVIGLRPKAAEDAPQREPATETRHDGSFALRDLRPGRISLVVRAGAVVQGESLDLTADLEVTIEILTGRLSGQVLAATGEPAAGTTVSLLREPGLGSWSAAALAVTDEAGTFEIPRVAAGSYRVTAEAKGFSPASHTLVVTPGGTTDLQVVLEPEARP